MPAPFTLEAAPLRLVGRRFKAGFHCHSTNSDGGLSPRETAERYRARGYHCFGLTDHRTVTLLDGVGGTDFLALPSTENGGDPDVIGVGVQAAVPVELPLAERAARLAAQGGFTIAAHPTYCGAAPAAYANCPALMALELYNAYCDAAYANGYATELWDLLLGQGVRLWGVAGDDAHLNPQKRHFSDVGFGWVEVWADRLTPDAVLAALKHGRFFSTQGPTFEEIEVTPTALRVACSPVQQVRWRTFGKVGYVEHAPAGASLTASILPPWFRPRGYVRVELLDAHHRRAWSNPFFVAG